MYNWHTYIRMLLPTFRDSHMLFFILSHQDRRRIEFTLCCIYGSILY